MPSAAECREQIAPRTCALATGSSWSKRAQRSVGRDRDRRVPFVSLNVRAHRAEWIGDTCHRPAAERLVAHELAGARSREPAHRSAGASRCRSCRSPRSRSSRRSSDPAGDVHGVAMVDRGTRGRAPRLTHVRPGCAAIRDPSASAAQINARWAIDLSDGQSRSSRAALSARSGGVRWPSAFDALTACLRGVPSLHLA